MHFIKTIFLMLTRCYWFGYLSKHEIRLVADLLCPHLVVLACPRLYCQAASRFMPVVAWLCSFFGSALGCGTGNA